MYKLYGYYLEPNVWANFSNNYLINATFIWMNGPYKTKAKNGLIIIRFTFMKDLLPYGRKNFISEWGHFWLFERVLSPQKSLLNLATFSQEIAYFGDFWLYVEISAFLMSGVLKKNGVLKVPICQHA